MSKLDNTIEECERLKKLIKQFQNHLKEAPEHHQPLIRIAIDFLKNQLSLAGAKAKNLEK